MNDSVPTPIAKSMATASVSKEASTTQTPKSREAGSTLVKVPVPVFVMNKYTYGMVSIALVLGLLVGGLTVFAIYSLTASDDPPVIPSTNEANKLVANKTSMATQTQETDPEPMVPPRLPNGNQAQTQQTNSNQARSQGAGSNYAQTEETSSKSTVKTECPKAGQCSLAGFTKPPLVILSLDGFRPDYMDTGILKTLESMRECGATAEHVYPSFPSATFPNHYSISTGKRPSHHGILANKFIGVGSDQPLPQTFIRENKMETFFVKSDPLYVQYEQEGHKSACYLYPGCNKNISGVTPTYIGRFDFSMDVTLEEKFNKTMDWLLMDESARPGLIMVYHPEPDARGHKNGGDIEDIKPTLSVLEQALSTFMDKLRSNGLIDCVNFLVVSDHGMQNITKYYDLTTMVNVTGLEAVGGIVGKVYNRNSTLTNPEIFQSLRNWAGTDYRVYLREELPPRWHYAESASAGDILFVEKPGVLVLENTINYNKESSKPINGGHGYDYLYKNLRTVFFAQGPSIKKGAVLKPFQNIEYLNLFRDLLGLPYYANDGTAGVMDDILINPPPRTSAPKPLVSECASSGNARLDTCSRCIRNYKFLMAERLDKCNQMQPFISSIDPICYQMYCEKSVIVNTGPGKNIVLWERLSKLTLRNTSTTCTVINKRYTASTGCLAGTQLDEMVSLSAAKQSEFSQIQEGMVKLPEGFVSDVLVPLNRLTRFYTDDAGQLLVVSGVTHDNDHNGIKDFNNTGAPTHFYRILLRCSSGWNLDGSCSEEEKLQVLSFIFPIFEEDRNDLKSEDLLLDYTARLKDVEQISGFELEIPNISLRTKNLLKTHINTNLW